MIPAAFDYLAPTSVEEALGALSQHGDDAKIMAGGQSLLPATADLDRIADHIRMLDADTYPRAFLDHGPLWLEFSAGRREGGTVRAEVTIRVRTHDDPEGLHDDDTPL